MFYLLQDNMGEYFQFKVLEEFIKQCTNLNSQMEQFPNYFGVIFITTQAQKNSRKIANNNLKEHLLILFYNHFIKLLVILFHNKSSNYKYFLVN